MSSLSDPGRPSRGDRRKIQKLIDAAYANGQLSAAERALRTQRVDAAHTRGDLAMIARDLGAPTVASAAPAGSAPEPVVVQDLQAPPPSTPQPSLGSAIDPALLRSMQVGGTYRGTGSSGSTPTINVAGLANAARTIKIVIAVVALGFLGICGLGLAAAIPAFLDGFNSTYTSPSEPTPSGNVATTTAPGPDDAPAESSLHTAAGWQALVDAIVEESGTASVYDLVVYPTYAAVGLDGGKAVERGFYRDGAWQDSIDVQTPIVGSPVDLREIDPELVAKLPDDAAQRLGVESPTGTYLIVNAIPSDPKIMVYVQFDGGSQYQAYTLDGTPRGF